MIPLWIIKRELKKVISGIKDIEKQVGGRIIFNDYQASADDLLLKIKRMEKRFANNSLYATAVQRSRRNHEEDAVINFR